MKAVLIGEPSGRGMDGNMAVSPRHKAVLDRFTGEGGLSGAGPYSDFGNMAIFRSREAAERFAAEDPFIPEDMVRSFSIKDWNDELLPG